MLAVPSLDSGEDTPAEEPALTHQLIPRLKQVGLSRCPPCGRLDTASSGKRLGFLPSLAFYVGPGDQTWDLWLVQDVPHSLSCLLIPYVSVLVCF